MAWFKKKSHTTTENDAYRVAINEWLLLCELEYDYFEALASRNWIESGKIADILHTHRTNCIELSHILLNAESKSPKKPETM